MVRLCLSLVVLSLIACAGPSRVSLDEQGLYHFEAVPFRVEAPQACMENMSVQAGEGSVRFTTGRNNWKADGDYRIEIYNVPGVGEDRDRFEAIVEQAFRDTMADAGNSIKSTEYVSINGRPAFQGLASDESIAMVLGTNILFPDHIVMVQLLYPSVPGEDDVEDLPWECHQRFVESIELVSAEQFH